MTAPRKSNQSRKHPTAKHYRFAEEYLIDLNATQAAIRAGYSPAAAYDTGRELLELPWVQELVAQGKAARAERTQLKADEVIDRLRAIAFADPRKLMEFRRRCCRHCYGVGFQYQYTASELEQVRASWAASPKKTRKPFYELGGPGFDAKLPPHPDCPECFGEGVGDAYFHDTSRVPPDVAALYAGVKVTKDGIEVKLHSQTEALLALGKHLGLFVEKHEIKLPEGTGVLAVPIPVDAAQWAATAAAQQAALLQKPAVTPAPEGQ